MRVTHDALVIDTPRWMLGDSVYDILERHDPCNQQVVVPVAPYNPRNTDDPKDIGHRVEDRIEEHSGELQLEQSILDETYNHRTGMYEPTAQSRTAASGMSASDAVSVIIRFTSPS